jgi:hypothetical protein
MKSRHTQPHARESGSGAATAYQFFPEARTESRQRWRAEIA